MDAPSLMDSDPFFRGYHKFACAFTNRMSDIVLSGEPWQSLYGVYRHFALVRTLIAINQVSLSLDHNVRELLKKTYEPEKIQIPSQFPVGTFERHRDIVYRDGVKHTYAIGCGGVTLDGTPTRSRADEATRGDVRLTGRMALDSMRSCIAANAAGSSGVAAIARARRRRRLRSNALVIT